MNNIYGSREDREKVPKVPILPKSELMNTDQIKNAFHDRGWDHGFYRGLADEAEAAGRLLPVRGE
jgi:hypothetical protein